MFYCFEKVVEGHTVTLEVSSGKELTLYVNNSVAPLWEADARLKLQLALAARQLWREALRQLPAGVYKCWATSPARRTLYTSAGWKPSPIQKGELVYYHQIPPVPTGGLTRGCRQ